MYLCCVVIRGYSQQRKDFAYRLTYQTTYQMKILNAVLQTAKKGPSPEIASWGLSR